jgi:hypothetical protein
LKPLALKKYRDASAGVQHMTTFYFDLENQTRIFPILYFL